MTNSIFSQSPYRCRLDWSTAGASRAAQQSDIIVLVDVLSFSTTVAYAVSKGAVVLPWPEIANAHAIAAREGAEVAVKRSGVPTKGRYSLSPKTFDNIAAGTKVVLPSLNGGTCTHQCRTTPIVIAGALINAEAVGRHLREMVATSESSITVIACGEREKGADAGLRMAIEDYLGAGAILAELPFDKSPEALVCESAFNACKSRLEELLWESVSGRELREAGFAGDVKFASRLNALDCVPRLKNGYFQ